MALSLGWQEGHLDVKKTRISYPEVFLLAQLKQEYWGDQLTWKSGRQKGSVLFIVEQDLLYNWHAKGMQWEKFLGVSKLLQL